MEKIKTVFPNSYKYSTAYQIASHNAIVARYKNEILKYEILKRDKRYKEDKIFRDKIDNELAKKIKNAPVSLQINDISIDVIIQNNSFNFYTRLSFVYKAGSLEQILMMKDY